MTQETEWKTIRLKAVPYFKLVELSGLLQTICGVQLSISTVANVAVGKFYDDMYGRLKEVLHDPKKLEVFRENLRTGITDDVKFRLSGDDLKNFLKT